ncbi:hypothetical protein EIN_176620 [Entamoeba invadens IP1]|uniref:hypothetical protein n=1 Tax=Entamoeba invadens IP1 TaxID=370355 RepID=UPI0002C3DD32|nr:hypothetical protein EIN_176620 [Entamoeba invadens IP1]ELP93835.1 hypothetical protein EIN_176620 [Entamoeba invadens IP1]|eukprot:XP_004260606.1 hypothetical protein EIN_176620 [Entamoeba invadens IP1]
MPMKLGDSLGFVVAYLPLDTVVHVKMMNKNASKVIDKIKAIPHYDKEVKYLLKVFPGCNEMTLLGTDIGKFVEGRMVIDQDINRLAKINLVEMPQDTDLLCQIRQKIVSISAKVFYYDNIELSDFPQLDKVVLDFCGQPFDFLEFFEDTYFITTVVIKNFNDHELLTKLLGEKKIAEKVYLETVPAFRYELLGTEKFVEKSTKTETNNKKNVSEEEIILFESVKEFGIEDIFAIQQLENSVLFA